MGVISKGRLELINDIKKLEYLWRVVREICRGEPIVGGVASRIRCGRIKRCVATQVLCHKIINVY